MGRIGLCLLISAACAASATTALAAKRPAKEKPAEPAPQEPVQDPNQCARAEASARWVGMGYTHVITLVNGCTKPVACELWSDVDADLKQSVVAKPGESVEIVTRRGSPSRELAALKTCAFR